MNWQKTVLVVAVLFAAVVVWLGRYDMQAASDGKRGFRLDRWTGNMVAIDMFSIKTYPPE